jgi:hypothetical protein
MAAGGAPVVAEVADVGGCVLVRRAADEAPLRVCCVLERGGGVTRVVQAEQQPLLPLASEIADLGIVGVRDHPRGGIEVADRPAPPVGYVLELAVAVELIAEEVA